jgi:lysophospholipase L1-like esterase
MTLPRSRGARSAFVPLVLLAASAAALPAQERFYLHDKDTVVFYGDSITEQRLYTTFVETFVLTRYPQLNVRFVNSGWGRETVAGGDGGPVDLRLTRDVVYHKATVMTVMLGMNDGGGGGGGYTSSSDEQRFNRYKAGMEHIVQTVKQALPTLRITLLEPSPFDDVTAAPQPPDGYNAVLVRYGLFLRELAQRNRISAVDLNGPMVEMLKRANAFDPAGAKTLIPGRVHPSAGGHLVMAGALLKAWGASPTVSAVEIDAASKQVAKADNTMVTGLNVGPTVTWSQKDAALPMLVSLRDPSIPTNTRRGAATMDLALKSSDFMEALNQQTLRIRGLAAARYTLKIDASAVGSFSREQLEQGVNLAGLPTPMARQSLRVHLLTMQKGDVHETRWKQLQVGLHDDNLARLSAALEGLDAVEEELAAQQRSAAQPVACSYELIPE